ncbi:MAG TPA: hypothetical protein PLQ35_16125 [bacterium]|nr:hypothetical protein [bacterium]HQL63807.1 hypothetical protein [bacterium]
MKQFVYSDNSATTPMDSRVMGFDPIEAHGSLRMTLGRFNTPDDVDYILQVLPETPAGIRTISTRKPFTHIQGTQP